MSAGLIPYSPHGEESRQSQKARQNPEIQGPAVGPTCSRSGRRWRNCSIPRSTAATPAWVRAPGCSRRRIIPGIAAPAARPPPIARARRRATRMMSRSGMRLFATSPVAGPHPTLPRKRERAPDRWQGVPAREINPWPRNPRPLSRGREEGQGGGASASSRKPRSEFAPANYGTAATIPTLDPELAKQLGFTTEEEDAAALARPPRNKMEALGVAGDRRCAGRADPRGPARIQGRGRPGKNLDAASPAAPGKIRRRRALRDQIRIRAEGRPAHRDQGTGRGHHAQRPHPGAARRHRLRQDLHHGQGDRGDAAPRHHSGAEQDAGGAALWRVQELLPRQRGGVFCLVLRLLPARGLCAAHRHLYREGFLDQRADRPHAPLGDAGAAGARRRHHRGLGVVHLRYRLGRNLHRDDVCAEEGRAHRPAPADRRPGGAAVQAHPGRFYPRHLSGARRRHRHLPGALRRPRLARQPVRRHRGEHRGVRSAHRPQAGRARIHQDLRQLALRDAAADADPGHQVDQERAEVAARPAARPGPPAGSAAAGAAHHLRSRNDGSHRQLRRHRKLFALSHRPPPRRAAADAVRICARQCAGVRRRKPRHRAADRRHVQRRFPPQGDAGGIRLPAALLHGQPAAALRGMGHDAPAIGRGVGDADRRGS